MRMLKKLLLAGAFIGVLGSFGFAQEAKADTVTKAEVVGDKLSYSVESTTSNNSISILIDGIDTGYTKTVGVDTVSDNNISIRDLVNGSKVGDFKSKDSVSTIEVKTTGGASRTGTGMKTLYRLIGEAIPATAGTVTIDGKALIFDYDEASTLGVKHIIAANAYSGYKFSKWLDSSSTSDTREVYASSSTTLFRAEFKSIPKATLYLSLDGGKTWPISSQDSDPSVVIGVGQIITLKATASGATGSVIYTVSQSDDYITRVVGKTNQYKGNIDSDYDYATIYATPSSGATFEESDGIDVYVDGTTSATKVTLSDFKDKNYITGGYALVFKAKADNGSKNITVEFTENGDYVDGTPSISTDSSEEYYSTITIKFKSDKLEKGNHSKEVKFAIKVDGILAKIANDKDDSNLSDTKTITVCSSPKNSYNINTGMSFELPTYVNTGKEPGKSDSLSYSQNEPFKVSGARLNVLVNDSLLGTTPSAKNAGQNSSINAENIDTVITNLGKTGKFTGNCTAALRVYPCDSSQESKVNQRVYHECYVDVRKVVVKVTSGSAASSSGSAKVSDLPLAIINPTDNLVAAARSTTTTTTTTSSTEKTYVAYGIVGRQVKWPDDFVEEKNRTAPTSEEKTITVNGNPLSSITVKSVDSENIYSGVAGARAASDSTGLDKVPRTGQSNVFVYVMAVVVCGAVGYGLYAYNKKSKKSI